MFSCCHEPIGQVCVSRDGFMTARKHFLVLWLTVSMFNISQQRMPTIFKIPSDTNTSPQSTWQRQYTSGLSFSGTMCTEPSYCQCQVMCARHCIDYRTSWEEARITHPIPVPQSSMDRRSNMRTLWIQHSISQIKKLTSFNRCAAISYIMTSP